MEHIFTSDIEGLSVALNFTEDRWLLFRTYYSPSQSDSYFFKISEKTLNTYDNYDIVLLAGDFDTGILENVMGIFLYQHDLGNLGKDKNCFNNVNNPSTFDLFLTNDSWASQKIKTTFTGLSDCHKFVLTALKTTFSRNKSK